MPAHITGAQHARMRAQARGFLFSYHPPPHAPDRRINHSLLAASVIGATALLSPFLALTARAISCLLDSRARAREGTPIGRCLLAPAPLPTLLLPLCCLLVVRSLRHLYARFFELFRTLSPTWQPPCEAAALPIPTLLLALLLTQAGLLACAIRMLLSPNIVWAGKTYARSRGRVARVLY